MPHENLIVLTKSPDTIEVWGSLKLACKNHPEFRYPTISRLKFPFNHQEWKFDKLKFNPTEEPRKIQTKYFYDKF